MQNIAYGMSAVVKLSFDHFPARGPGVTFHWMGGAV